jgi:hypothetical protein
MQKQHKMWLYGLIDETILCVFDLAFVFAFAFVFICLAAVR